MNYTTIIIITVIFSAFFSGMEIAFVGSNKLRFELDKKKKKLSSSILTIFYDNPQQFIATMLVGNNIALVVYGIMMASSIEPFIAQYVSNSAIVLLVQTIISTIIILITAEFIPKTIFRINPSLFLNFFSPFLLMCYILLYPIASSSAFLSKNLLLLFRVRLNDEDKEPVFGKVDLYDIVEQSLESTDENELQGHDKKLFQNVLDFSNVKLRNCIVPRTEIVALEIEESAERLVQVFIETGYSKVLIYKETIDNIIGYIHLSDLFQTDKNLRKQIRNIPIVPETMAASKLMSVFMKDNKSIAVVVDEFGGTSGIVTLEDIMEEIFGEIEDEHDKRGYKIQKLNDKEFVLPGRLEIDFINEELNLNLPESDEFETLAGYILHEHETLPSLNEEIEMDLVLLKVLQVTTTRIELIKLTIK